MIKSFEIISNTTHNPITKFNEKEKTFEKIYEDFKARDYSKVPLKSIISEICLEKEKTNKTSDLEAFYLINLTHIINSYKTFIKNLPRVRPYYAVKCNPDFALLSILNELGAGFDCASQAELELVEKLGVNFSKDVIFANPCKQYSHIEHAKKIGVEWTTIDNLEELIKISNKWSESKVVIRISIDDSKSTCPFSSKFGANYEQCEKILEKAKELNVNIVGVSFHVGSGCFSVESYLNAIKGAKKVFLLAENFGFKMNLLDIGGGFPGSNSVKPNFIEMAKEISPLIDELFEENIQIIAEPGRYFAHGSHTLVCNIFGKREVYSKNQLTLNDIKQEYLYYANDGIYNSFSCLFFDNAKIDIIPFSTKKTFENSETFKSKIFGPTCDALDVICTNTQIPKLEVGDWFYVNDFGAYTRSCTTNFNGFKVDKCIYYYQ